jgi:hypothetical protein
MKKLFFLFLIFTISLNQKGSAQDSAYALPGLLKEYYAISNALVAGNSSNAAQGADAFIKVVNTVDYKIISEGNINALLKDATAISESKDIKVQRTHFANLSNNMILVAKEIKLSSTPVYQVYCPMKKAYWLSQVNEVKNPYYGSAMLTCGNVVDTIKH